MVFFFKWDWQKKNDDYCFLKYYLNSSIFYEMKVKPATSLFCLRSILEYITLYYSSKTNTKEEMLNPCVKY